MKTKIKRSELKELIFELYVEHLRKQNEVLLTEDADKDAAMVFGGDQDGAVLPDSTDQILAKFPTVKHALVRLHSDDFKEFVSGVDWISPRPSVFRVNLTNGQNYILKWMGKDFEMEIMGKTYYLGTLTDYQRALQKLTILYQEGPMGQSEEGGEGAPDGGDIPGGGGGGSFPGEDAFGGSEDNEDVPGGDEGDSSDKGSEGDKESKDLSNDSVDFEADSDI